MSHIPVLLDRFLEFFAEKKLTVFIDGTLGAGGHALALLKEHPEIETFYGLDRDEEILKIAKEKLESFQKKLHLIHMNYREIDELEPADGIFLDLGVSSVQLDRPERGFSFYKEGPLDMRMDTEQQLDAESVVNNFSEKKLGEIFREYGEETRWKAAAKAVVEARKKKRLKTTTDLAEALKQVLTWGGRKGKKIHPLTLVFQGLRIYVNDELKGVEEALPKAIAQLKPGGRLGVIAFHSLEDRIVKQTFREFAVKKEVILLTKKPIEADVKEAKENPRSRSAKLRFIEKL